MRQLRITGFASLLVVIGLACNSQRKSFDGPTVDAFNGRVVADGKPVAFPAGEEIVLRVFHKPSGKMWGIPIQPDGTFKIGWMPIGNYSSMLQRQPKNAKGRGGALFNVPGEFQIVDGQTEYTIDLGKNFKP